MPGSFAVSALKRAGIGFVSILFLTASDPAIADSPSPELPADWVRVSAGGAFSLMAPAGTAFHPAQGVDSTVGSFQAPDFKLSFDYGRYSDSLTHMSSEAEYETRDIVVDGKTAYIVTSFVPQYSADRPYFIGIHFPEVGETTMGPTKLTVYGLLETVDGYALVEAIFATIRFD